MDYINVVYYKLQKVWRIQYAMDNFDRKRKTIHVPISVMYFPELYRTCVIEYSNIHMCHYVNYNWLYMDVYVYITNICVYDKSNSN